MILHAKSPVCGMQKDLPTLGAPARRYVPAGSSPSITAGLTGNRIPISFGMEITVIPSDDLFFSSVNGILSLRVSTKGCSPSGATDGIGAVVSLSVPIARLAAAQAAIRDQRQ